MSHAPLIGLLLLSSAVAGCGEDRSARHVVRLAVTTSTYDSGLLDVLVPTFEAQKSARVDVIVAGTGRALKLGENGDVDVVLVHAREMEMKFMADGHGARHEPVMHNRFEILGPADDPAHIAGMTAPQALNAIAGARARFVSRGDDSGTHKHELKLWAMGGSRPGWDGYIESGQGMGATLIMADQMQTYTLCDRGTYLAFIDRIELTPIGLSGDEMINPYGLLAVNPSKNDRINHELASALIDFLISDQAQKLIQDFHVGGERLFEPRKIRNHGDHEEE